METGHSRPPHDSSVRDFGFAIFKNLPGKYIFPSAHVLAHIRLKVNKQKIFFFESQSKVLGHQSDPSNTLETNKLPTA